ncbi:MAG: DUF167 domain-containing protein [Rhodospirillales bacterium]|jgi:hypothetical protein|nr:DUF167 domain-containing protein [Rhodospirillales bacterium]
MPCDLSDLKITERPNGCCLTVKVVPGSSRNRIVGTLGQALKVAVSAPAEKGAANKALLKLLSKFLDLPPAQIQILSGKTQARKQILVLGLSAAQLRSSLA